MNDIQHEIFWGAMEESGIWEIISSIAAAKHVDREAAFNLLKSELNFIKSNENIYFICSEKLYDSETSKIMDKDALNILELHDVEFHEEGPFYYVSSYPKI